MSEEVRFFLRTALYTGLIATIYWVMSYEEAGTVLLAFLMGAALFFVGIVTVLVRSTHHGAPGRAKGPAGLIKTVLGFEEPGAEASDAPMELTDDVFPAGSIWPFVCAVAVTILLLGLIYGPWLWIPGLGLTIASALNWMTELPPRA